MQKKNKPFIVKSTYLAHIQRQNRKLSPRRQREYRRLCARSEKLHLLSQQLQDLLDGRPWVNSEEVVRKLIQLKQQRIEQIRRKTAHWQRKALRLKRIAQKLGYTGE